MRCQALAQEMGNVDKAEAEVPAVPRNRPGFQMDHGGPVDLSVSPFFELTSTWISFWTQARYWYDRYDRYDRCVFFLSGNSLQQELPSAIQSRWPKWKS